MAVAEQSYTCKPMASKGRNVLVCPTTRLTNNYNKNNCTLNKLFGIGLPEGTSMATFVYSGYDTIIFDEILFCSVRRLARSKR